MAAGNADEALRFLQEYCARPDANWMLRAEAFCNMADVHLRKGTNLGKAREMAAQAAAIRHNMTRAYTLLGDLCAYTDNLAPAVFWYEAAVNAEKNGGDPAHAARAGLANAHYELGNEQLARQAAEQASQALPDDPRVVRVNFAIGRSRNGRNKKLNLGCGGKHVPGYVSCDLYPGPGIDEVFSLDNVPYADGTIGGIYSEHAIEHLPRLRAEKTIAEWARVMATGAELHLKCPDAELCCLFFANADDNDRYEWWHHTIYGIQESQLHEPDDGQFHLCGFTKGRLQQLLESAGFEISHLERYDGQGTPSIEVRARKK